MPLFGKKEEVEYQEVKQKLATIESSIAEMKQNFDAMKITVDQLLMVGMETLATEQVKDIFMLPDRVARIARELETLRGRIAELEGSVKVAATVSRK